MKKVGIISDTHNLLRPEIKDILKSCDCIIHAGDVCKPEILDEIRWFGNLYVVKGNNDWAMRSQISKIQYFQIEDVKFVLVHNISDLGMASADANVVIYGHSHKYSEKMINGQLWLNPGSCGIARFGGEVTMAIMTIDGGRYQVEKIQL